MRLGDAVAAALATVGVTPEAAERWLGACHCHERRERLNALGAWAARVLAGRSAGARDYLNRLLGDEPDGGVPDGGGGGRRDGR